MRSEYARDAAGMGLVPQHQTVPDETLSARVNFKDRHPSMAQTIMAIGVWVMTFGLIGITVASFSMKNATLIPPDGACPPDWQRLSGFPMCVSQDIFEQGEICDAKMKAAGPSSSSRPRYLKEELPMLEKKSMFDMLGSLPILLPILLVLAIGWFTLLRFAAHCAVWSTVGVFVLVCLFGFYLLGTQGWPIAVVGVGFAIYTATMRNTISQGCQCLQGGLQALSEMSMSLPVIIAIAMLVFVYIGLFMTFFVNANLVWSIKFDGQACIPTTMLAQFGGPILFFFSFAVNFCYMVLNFTIAFTMGCWYFHSGDPEAPATPMCDGLRRALFTRNGNGVCGQAGFVMAIVEYLEKEMKKAQRNPCVFLNPIMCILYCAMAALKQCLESMTTFALVAVAIEGGPFCATARLATRTIGVERAARFLIIDSTLGWLLKMQATLIATTFGFACFFIIDAYEGLDIAKGLTEAAKQMKNEVDRNGSPDGPTGTMMIVWMLTLMVVTMWGLVRKPLSTILFVVIAQAVISMVVGAIPAFAAAMMACLLIAAVASLLLHFFAEAACGALSAMTYCWCLDEAVPALEQGTSASQQNARSKVKSLMGEATATHSAMEPNASPNTNQTSPVVELGGAQATQMVNIQCPENVFPGQEVMANINGVNRVVTVPQNVRPGQFFQVAI